MRSRRSPDSSLSTDILIAGILALSVYKLFFAQQYDSSNNPETVVAVPENNELTRAELARILESRSDQR